MAGFAQGCWATGLAPLLSYRPIHPHFHHVYSGGLREAKPLKYPFVRAHYFLPVRGGGAWRDKASPSFLFPPACAALPHMQAEKGVLGGFATLQSSSLAGA